MSSVFLNVRMLKSLLSTYPNVISLMLLLSVALAPLSVAMSKYLLHFHSWEEEDIKRKFLKRYTITTQQLVSLAGWLVCHVFVNAHKCLISYLFSGRQSQTVVMPLILFICVCVVGLRHSAQHWTTSWCSGEIWPRWKFLLEIPTIPAAYGHMLTLHLSHHPIFHPILNQTPHTSTLWLLRRAQSMTIITIEHTPFALSHATLPWVPKSPAHRRLYLFSGGPRLISFCSIIKTQWHAYIHPCLILPPFSGLAGWWDVGFKAAGDIRDLGWWLRIAGWFVPDLIKLEQVLYSVDIS